MKKLTSLLLMISIVLSSFMPIFPMMVEAGACDYEVVNIKSDGTFTSLSCNTNYTDAKTSMLAHASNEDNVAGIYYNGNLLMAKYAIALLNNNGGAYFYLYKNKSDSSYYTYIEATYGSEAAIIDYDPGVNRYQIKISGVVGWVNAANVKVQPISNINAQTKTEAGMLGSIRANYDDIAIRKDAAQSADRIRYTVLNEAFNYYEVKNTGDVVGRLWYKIKLADGSFGWMANQDDWCTLLPTTAVKMSLKTKFMIESQVIGSKTFYLLKNYYAYKNTDGGSVLQSSRVMGLAPYELFETNGLPNTSKSFYSFDGNFFYNTIADMIDDYRADVNKSLGTTATDILNAINQKAINKNKPYFAYHMYLPTHSKTGYTAEDFNQDIKDRKFTGYPVDDRTTYVNCERDANNDCLLNTDGTVKFISSFNSTPRTGLSLMYNQGANFIKVGNDYGINSLLMYATALNESATGTSVFAFAKNNLFGLNATDTNPFENAFTYDTPYDSMVAFAKLTGTNYSSPTSSVYYSSHYGNKNSGMNVSYASDPYWGLKKAAGSMSIDSELGYNDYEANTIGIKLTSAAIPVKKTPSTSGTTIYELKNKNTLVSNMAMIILDKVKDANGNYWYKVQTDPALDESQNMGATTYNFNYSYGYVEAKYIYTSNSQPTINANNVSIKQGDTVNLLSGVTASDPEDGNITNSITYSGYYDANTIGTYDITYTALDSSRFSVSKSITLTVLPADKPLINATDKEITVNTVFDPLKDVTATDYKDGNLPVTVVSNNVNTSVVGSYSVTYKAVNSFSKETTKTITVYVVANQKPVITANNQTISLNATFDPLKYATAVDVEDGDVTSRITVLTNEVKTNIPGTYKVTYKVTDTTSNESTLDIFVTVESMTYTKKTGEFYFEKALFNSTTKLLDVEGYLSITGINNTVSSNPKYDLIIKSNTNNTEYIKPLSSWTTGAPTRKYSDSKYDYSATWFKGSVNLSDLPIGEYTLYIRARIGNYESLNLFRNMFEKEMSRKFSDNVKGYQLRNNNYDRNYPMELFVSDDLISTVTPTVANMINNYRTLAFSGNYLNIVGNSFNVGVDYSSSTTVTRDMIFEDLATGERYIFSIGSYVGTDIPLRVSDGFSKVRGWYDTTNKIDITTIPKGRYKIIIRTKVGNFVDHGELTDIFLKSLTQKTTIASKTYSFVLNQGQRFRVEMKVE